MERSMVLWIYAFTMGSKQKGSDEYLVSSEPLLRMLLAHVLMEQGVFQAPRAGLEPTTRRLTAGCSAS